ncbi:MAG: MFS transporter [Alphaproteobacteria bacterium]|nr:MFS transporter [Alphaproteobacteria bacterium]
MTIATESASTAPQGLSRATSLILAAALFMEMMDSTIIATALPSIASDIGTDPVSLKLALTSYLVALAVFIPISGWLSDRVGARNLLSFAILVFIIGSIACAFSNSLGSFVLSRFLQGMGGSMMTPVARILLVRSTPRDQLVSAMAWLAVPALMGPMMGPPIGGILTSYLSWHWIFLVNIPIGVLGIFMTRKYIPRLGIRRKTPLDLAGFILSAVAFAGIVFGLSVISLPALHPVYGIVAVVVGLICGVVYWHHAKSHATPILNPKIFSNGLFFRSVAGGFIFRLGIGATPFLMPLLLQVGYGLSPVESGLITFAGALGAIAFKFIAQRFYKVLGLKLALSIAVVGAVVALSVSGFIPPSDAIWLLLAALFVAGLARSAFFTVATAMALSGVSDEETGQASALVSVAQNISIALAVAVAGSVLQASSYLRDSELGLIDLRIAVLSAAAISACAIIFLIGLPRGADSILMARNPAKSEPVE